MTHDTQVFTLLQRFIGRKEVEAISRKHGGERYIKKFGAWGHLWVMVFAHLTGRESLKHIVAGFFGPTGGGTQRGKNAGLEKLSDSRLSEANAERPAAIFEEIFQNLFTRYEKMARHRTKAVKKLLKNIRIIDSTVVTVSRKLAPWAAYKRNPDRSLLGGVKFHFMYDLFLACPCGLKVTAAKIHDANKTVRFAFRKGLMYVFDRGYFNFDLFQNIMDIGADFVTRWKRIGSYRVVKRLEVTEWQKDRGVMRDEIIKVGKGAKRMKELLRLVVFRDEQGRVYHFLTNRFDLSPCTIAMLYRKRWQIETFFKWIKQHLKIKHLFGFSDNAVKVQIWTALIAYLLMQITRLLSGYTDSLLEWTRHIVDMLSISRNREPMFDSRRFNEGISQFQRLRCLS